MKHAQKWIILLLALLLAGCGARTKAADGVRLFAVNVGKGDALILQVGDWTGLIDAGRARARGRVTGAMDALGIERLNAVFLTHTDGDHAGGLDWLTGLPVDEWYASAVYTGVKAEKHPAVRAAAVGGRNVNWLQRGDVVPLGDTEAVLRVLAPASQYEDEDDNSLVMMLESSQGKILFTGDMERFEEAQLLSFGDDLKCAVLKVANHGDDDSTSAAFAAAAGAQLAVISTDSQEKPGTPDPGVVSRLQAAGSWVVVTQDSGLGLLVTLSGGAVTAETVEFGKPPVQGLYVAEVDADDDRIVLGNSGDEAAALDGFYLYSDRGDEIFAFPEGTTIGPGAAFVVGTQSTEGGCDLVWDDRKVIHRKKTDVICLYDSLGRLVDCRDNGL